MSLIPNNAEKSLVCRTENDFIQLIRYIFIFSPVTIRKLNSTMNCLNDGAQQARKKGNFNSSLR